MKQDKLGADVAIDYWHSKAHHGLLWKLVDTGANVQIASPKYWHIRTPNTSKRIHFYLIGNANAAVKIELYEAPTFTLDGTAITPLNSDRSNTIATTVLLAFKDPTLTVDGTLIATKQISTAGGSVQVNDDEIILAKNTDYFLKFTVGANGTNVVLAAKYYEE